MAPASPAASSAPTASGSSTASPAAAPDADLVVLLRPSATPSPQVHVEIALPRSDGASTSWHIARGTPDRITLATAHDATGDIAVDVSAATPGVVLHLARATKGAATLSYDILAGDDAPDDPQGLLVLDDRFRGAGEKLIALPDGAEDTRANVMLRIDGDALRASGAASSFGVGAARRTSVPPRALRYATYVAGSLGVQVIDDPAAGHDEGAWLGYTAFDPRPTVAELAQIRSSLRELFKSQLDTPPWTHLFVSQTRPIGSFTTTPRWQSVLLQVGPGEPWSASLRLSMAQQLARLWIGGELRVATEAGREAEGGWFSEGVSRYAATLLLDRLGLMTPDDVRDAVTGELSVLATSPHKALGNAQLSALSKSDPVARAMLMARGALYALREAAAIRAKTKGERGLDAVLVALIRQAEDKKQPALAVSAWLDAAGKDDPDAAKTFDSLVVKGDAVTLPPDALGPCFRAGTGDYVAFDAGFDVEATRVSRDGKVVGVRPGGPAANAGVQEGDVVESMQAHEGDAESPVKLALTRAGSKVSISYSPRGAHGRGQTWTRLRQIPDDKCGELP